MSHNDSEKSGSDELNELLDNLTLEQQNELRRRLNYKAWAKRFGQLESQFQKNKDKQRKSYFAFASFALCSL